MSASKLLYLGNSYSKKELSHVLNIPQLSNLQEGVFSNKEKKQVFLFVDLEKGTKEKRFQFHDFFSSDIFHWDSQTTQHINTPLIQKIVRGEVEVELFARIFQKLKSKTQPFVYCGRLKYFSHSKSRRNPCHILFESLDYNEDTNSNSLKAIYDWKSSNGSPHENSEYSNDYLRSGRKNKPNLTERQGLVISRVGQGYYRQEVIKKWNGKCAITGSACLPILIASHIKKWSEAKDEERLDPSNGILLSPNYDALFDKHLLTFKNNGEMVFSKTISQDDIARLSIDKSLKLPMDSYIEVYLEHHRNCFWAIEAEKS